MLLAQVAEKRRVTFSEMIRAAEPLSTRSLNCLGFDGGLSSSIKKARADFYMFLNHRHKNVDDCGKVRPVRVANADGVP